VLQALQTEHPAHRAYLRPGRASGAGFVAAADGPGARQAVCPAGKTNTQCSRLEEGASGKVSYRFECGGWVKAFAMICRHVRD